MRPGDLLAFLGTAVRGVNSKEYARLAHRLSADTLVWLQRLSFRRMVRYAGKHSRYYRGRFKAEGIDPRGVRGPEDLKDFYTPAADLIGRTEDFICEPPVIAFESTGTTGRSKRIFFSKRDWKRAAIVGGTGYLLAGMRPGDRALNTFTLSYWISGLAAQAAAEAAGIFCLPAGKSDAEEAFGKIAQYEMNVLLGLPAYIVRLTELAEANGVPRQLKVILSSGDGMSEPVRQQVEQVWNCPVVQAYGASEGGGGIGMECPQRNGYHYNMYNVLCEVKDPDAEGYGSLVVSWLSARCMPIIRAPIGDIARIEREKCACGQASHRISCIRGRVDEMFMLAGYNFYPDFVCRAFDGVKGITPDYQGVITLRGMRPILTMRFELKNGANELELRRTIESNLKSLAPDLWKCFEEKMADFEIEFAPPGTVRTGRKILRFVDKREEAATE